MAYLVGTTMDPIYGREAAFRAIKERALLYGAPIEGVRNYEEAARTAWREAMQFNDQRPFDTVLRRFDTWVNGYAPEKEAEKEVERQEFGVPYYNGKPVPENWKGAPEFMLDGSIVHIGGVWHVSAKSVFADAQIIIEYDAGEMGHREAMRRAETTIEALNQRRMG